MGQQQPFPFALPKTDWRPPDVSKLPSWRDAKRVGYDVETRDPDLLELGPGVRRDKSENYVCGISFAIEDGPEHYLPIRHDGGDNLDPQTVWSYLRDQIRDFRGVIYGAHAEYDLDWSADEVPEILAKPVVDVQVTDVLINELHDHYDLETLCARWDLPGKDEQDLRQAASAYRVDPKADLWKLPARYVERYGRADARRVLQIARRQQREVDAQELGQICALEWRVTPILVKMRRRGVRVDLDRVDVIERRALDVEAEELAAVKSLTGVQVAVGDVWKSKVLAHALSRVGINAPVTAAGNSSIENEWLAKCGPVGAHLQTAREWNKIRTTYCQQMRRFSVRTADGDYRVHPTTNQVRSSSDRDAHGRKRGKGVRYGRTSCDSPSVQNQPVRSDLPTGLVSYDGCLVLADAGEKSMKLGEVWRSVFCADRGARWGCADWRQQEPRIGVHYAEALGLPGAREFADGYRSNPKLDVHQKLADLSGIQRKIVKNYVNGLLYGMGNAKLCDHIGQPTEWRSVRGEMRRVAGPAGQAIIDQFEKFAPWLRGLTRAASRQAERCGHVWTILRRKCHFPRKPGTDEYDWTHKAFSRVGQGGAADQMKATLCAADAEGIPIQMVIHDEFDWSFTEISQARRLKELQETTVRFSVPMDADLEVGDNWGELEKLEAA